MTAAVGTLITQPAMSLRSVALLAPLLAIAPPVPAAAGRETPKLEYELYRLENGLTVILHQDRTVPLVAVHVEYDVGSKDEKPQRTGFAHLFEHLMFQGTAHLPKGMADRLLTAAGADNNGGTSQDATVYWEVGPANALSQLLYVESERMGWLLPVIDQAKLDNQRDVVRNERRQNYEMRPYGLAIDRVMANLWNPEFPYHWLPIGSHEDLERATLEDVREFFLRWYGPENAVLAIAGDFDPAEARRLVQEYFGPIPRGAGKPPLPDMTLPPTFGEWKREVVEDEVALPRLFLVFRIPPFGHDEHYAASVASAILGMRKGSRLQRRLVRERQVASEAGAFTYDLSKGSDLLVVDVTARPGVGPDQMESEVAREIDDLREHGVRAEEVERAVALVRTEYASALQSAGDRADRLSMFATYFGDPALANAQLARYEAVTAEQVNAFARARLGEDNRASLLYVPREQGVGRGVSGVEAEVSA